MKYGWIAIVTMIGTLLSPGLVAAQYGSDKRIDAKGDQKDDTPPAQPDEEPMSELQKLKAMEAESEVPTVDGERPPVDSDTGDKMGETGLGTQAAERTREYAGIGEVGRSVNENREEAIPLRVNFHGYYRTRYNWIGNAPVQVGTNPAPTGEFPIKNASFGEMRLRLDPEVSYGPNPDLPIAKLRFTIDGFDNVVWGDNARVFSTPLFSVDQAYTDRNGFDLRDSLKLERAWIEFLVPIGQIRVGRMESQWGVGTLTHAGNGLAEWGEFYRGETFDRVVFATRPITLARGISKGDTRETPLIYAFVYDRLTQDPVIDSTISSSYTGASGAATNPNFKPFYTTFDERSTFPLAYLTNLDRRVSEIVNVLAWHDEEYGRGATDELFVGAYVVYRYQRSTESRVTIPDVAWRLKHTLKNNRRLAITTEGEYYTILGHSGALAFTNQAAYGDLRCPPAPCNKGKAGIHNVLARLGVMSEGKWATQLEGGFASGDANILSGAAGGGTEGPPPKLTTRGFNENIKVGLLMYQVALKALTFQKLQPFGAIDLGANGSVWNSVYFLPSGRVTIVPGLEFHTQFLIAWADKLDPLIYGVGNKVGNCHFQSSCFYGYEIDAAFRARLGARDVVWIDLEGGFMQPGQAFTNAGFQKKGPDKRLGTPLWTTQIRAAMIF
ncbi:MAG: hypothetical protein PVH76_00410 [Myxococcales bacterium]